MQSSSLHDTAVNAEAELEQLATELAHAGADRGAVDAVSKCADVVRQVVKALGAGQEQTGNNQPPAPQPGPASLSQGAADVHYAMQAASAHRAP